MRSSENRAFEMMGTKMGKQSAIPGSPDMQGIHGHVDDIDVAGGEGGDGGKIAHSKSWADGNLRNGRRHVQRPQRIARHRDLHAAVEE